MEYGLEDNVTCDVLVRLPAFSVVLAPCLKNKDCEVQGLAVNKFIAQIFKKLSFKQRDLVRN